MARSTAIGIWSKTAASLVVTGLGSDAGIVDFDGTLGVLRKHAPADVVRRVTSASTA